MVPWGSIVVGSKRPGGLEGEVFNVAWSSEGKFPRKGKVRVQGWNSYFPSSKSTWIWKAVCKCYLSFSYSFSQLLVIFLFFFTTMSHNCELSQPKRKQGLYFLDLEEHLKGHMVHCLSEWMSGYIMLYVCM